MAKKNSTRRYNKLLYGRNHYFGFGDFLFKPDKNGQVTNRSLGNLSSLGSGLVSAAGNAVGQMGGAAIGGGLQSGVGNALQGLSSIAGAIPGSWGAVAQAGLGVASGITNRLFGSQLNEENIAKVEANINSLKNFQSNASTFDSLANNWANADVGMTFSDSFIGKDGTFSNKAAKKASNLRNQIAEGEAWVQNTLDNNAENIRINQMQNLLGNFSAFGGPIDFIESTAHYFPFNSFSDGGGIHIKPSKKGTFTAAAKRHGLGVQEFANKVLANKENYSSTMIKKANFARNASKWKHAFGGDLLTHGANFDTGVTLIGNGGTHEENPLEGVPMGVDAEGIPNLVEEGEVIFNDYVFSDRLKVPKEVRKKYKLRGTKPLTFAEAAIQMSKESEERPNDPISKAGLEANMTKLMIAQEQLRMEKNKTNTFSKGGKMGRIYAGEEGDPYSQALLFDMGPVSLNSMWSSGTSPTEEPNTPKNRMGIVLGGYTSNPTVIKPGESTIPEIIETQRTQYPTEAIEYSNNDIIANDTPLSPTWMRYIPAYASGVMSLTDALGLTNKPDYGEAEAVLEATRNAGTYTPIRFNPIGNYLTYRPFDRNYYTNKLNAESSATRRAIFNTSGGNRAQAMAGILAADYNAQGRMGDLFRQAEEYNLAQRQKVEEFNRATNTFNTEGAMKADIANQEALLKSRDSYLKGTLAASELRQRERQQTSAARSANLSNFINSLGDIGRENFARNMIVSDPSKYYTLGADGKVTYKNGFDKLSDAEKRQVRGHAAEHGGTSFSRGGLLTIKGRRK